MSVSPLLQTLADPRYAHIMASKAVPAVGTSELAHLEAAYMSMISAIGTDKTIEMCMMSLSNRTETGLAFDATLPQHTIRGPLDRKSEQSSSSFSGQSTQVATMPHSCDDTSPGSSIHAPSVFGVFFRKGTACSKEACRTQAVRCITRRGSVYQGRCRQRSANS